MKKYKKVLLICIGTPLLGVILLVIGSLIYAYKSDELRDNMISYYIDDSSYEECFGTITRIEKKNDNYDTLRIVIYVNDNYNIDNEDLKICIYTTYSYYDEFNLNVGNEILIQYNNKNFYDGWIMPVYYLECSDKVILDYDSSKKQLLNWIKMNIGL